MTLYHFTAKCFLKSIQRDGLTRGMLLESLNPIKFIPMKQWLTSNKEFDQSWLNPNSTLPYKRNEVRLEIEIPECRHDDCRPWAQMKFMVPAVAKDLSAFGDPENWWVFDGKIPPGWIKAIEEIEK